MDIFYCENGHLKGLIVRRAALENTTGAGAYIQICYTSLITVLDFKTVSHSCMLSYMSKLRNVLM
jgi:hypothetical protein